MSTEKAARVLEALVAGLEDALAAANLTDDEVVEVLEGMQVELDGMLERAIAEGVEDVDEDI